MMTHANDVQQIMRDIQSPYLVVVALYGTQGHLKAAGFRKFIQICECSVIPSVWVSQRAFTVVK